MATILVMAIFFHNVAYLANGDITCPAALLKLLPCEAYLAPFGPSTPPVTCCNGVQYVNTQTTSTEIRRSLCECFKKVAAVGLPVIDLFKLQQLPQFCKVTLPVPLDPNIDCSSIPLF